jgi:hypothetical protein
MKMEIGDREAERGKRERERDWYEWAYGPGGQTACQGVYSGLIVCLNFFRRHQRINISQKYLSTLKYFQTKYHSWLPGPIKPFLPFQC